MRTVSAIGRIAALSLVASIMLPPADVYGGVRQCENAITTWFHAFAKSRLRALYKCEEDTVQDQQPPGTVCAIDPTVVAEVIEDLDRLVTEIRDRCGGHNRTCNAADAGIDADIPLASIGWDLGVCPDFEGAGCTNAINDCGDIADCLACIGLAAVDQAVALPYGALVLPTRETDPPLNKCQIAVGKEAVKYLRRKMTALKTCQVRVRRGQIAGPCPDAKAAEKLANAEEAKVDHICARCGGVDKTCDGSGDFEPSAIGFPTTCPAVTVPGGSSCAANVTTLAEMVTCLDCVLDFKVACLDGISALDVTSYPAECPAAP